MTVRYNFSMNNYLEQQLNEIDNKIEQVKKVLSDPELSDLARAEIADL